GKQQVHRNHRELETRAALQEQDAIVRRHAAERPDVSFGLLEDRLERFRAVADLEDRHPDAGQRDEVALNLLEDRQWQNRGACRKIEDALHDSHEGFSQKATTKTRSHEEEYLVSLLRVLRGFVVHLLKLSPSANPECRSCRLELLSAARRRARRRD